MSKESETIYQRFFPTDDFREAFHITDPDAVAVVAQPGTLEKRIDSLPSSKQLKGRVRMALARAGITQIEQLVFMPEDIPLPYGGETRKTVFQMKRELFLFESSEDSQIQTVEKADIEPTFQDKDKVTAMQIMDVLGLTNPGLIYEWAWKGKLGSKHPFKQRYNFTGRDISVAKRLLDEARKPGRKGRRVRLRR